MTGLTVRITQVGLVLAVAVGGLALGLVFVPGGSAPQVSGVGQGAVQAALANGASAENFRRWAGERDLTPRPAFSSSLTSSVRADGDYRCKDGSFVDPQGERRDICCSVRVEDPEPCRLPALAQAD